MSGLHRVPTQPLRTLHTLLGRGGLRFPVTAARLRQAGLSAMVPHLALFEGCTPQAVAGWVQAVLAEREQQRGAKLELVWSGPEPAQTQVRDTGHVLRDLFEQAQHSVLVAGYSFAQGDKIFEPLYLALRDRGVQVTVCMNVPGFDPDRHPLRDPVARRVRHFFAETWPFGEPTPRIYYDPRTLQPGHAIAALHSKCVVVDDRQCFITSANFTFNGQNRNVETGVRIEDADFARELSGHWQALIRDGLLTEHKVQAADLQRCRVDVRVQQWDELREGVAEEYLELFDQLKTLQLPAPDDVAYELVVGGRSSGAEAICVWDELAQPVALVRPGDESEQFSVIAVEPHADPEQVAAQLRPHLCPQLEPAENSP